MVFYVFSWNMQGWGNQYRDQGIRDDAKIQSALRAIQNCPPNSRILMLQECGNPESTRMTKNSIWTGLDGERYKCHINAADPTADNLRCSTAILVSENLEVDECGVEAFGGVTRPCVYVKIGDICFATMHAVANSASSVTDVKKAIELLEEKYTTIDGQEKKRTGSWVLMGDFNSDPTKYGNAADLKPDKLNDVQINGSSSRTGLMCKMIYSKEHTQGAAGDRTKSLDFAFLSGDAVEGTILYYDLEAQTKVFNEQQSAGSGRYLSDHNLIGLGLANNADD